MKKVSTDRSNDFCPQTLFLYGTYKEDGTPNFGLFCWFSYIWDEELGVMACIGGEKLTKDLIREKKVFSANLVTEELLPLADYYGNKEGYDADKMVIMPEVEQGAVLQVPLLKNSPWSYELEVMQEMQLHDSSVFLCKIRNVMADESLVDKSVSVEERINRIAPVTTTHSTYFSHFGKVLGVWGGLKNNV